MLLIIVGVYGAKHSAFTKTTIQASRSDSAAPSTFGYLPHELETAPWEASKDKDPLLLFSPKPQAAPREVLKDKAQLVPVPIAQGVLEDNTPYENVAPLRIVTPPGSDSYYIKLVDTLTGSVAMVFYVFPGQTLETEVPIGAYRLKYATGSIWYGRQDLFGPGTEYSEADQTFSFRKTDQGVTGYTVTLIRQAHGNLRTKKIRPQDF